MTSVLVTVPNVHWIHQHVVYRLLMLQHDRRYRLSIELPSHKPYENNQHHIMRDFLEGRSKKNGSSETTYEDFWLSIDADNPPLRNPLDLVELDRDIIGLPTPIWHYTGGRGERPIYWNVYRWNEEKQAYNEWSDREGLQRVDAIGTGCFIVARRVFEHPDMQRGCFSRKLNADGTVDKGNDISFCERARECGFEVYAHFGYPCRHFCEVDLHESAMAMKGLI